VTDRKPRQVTPPSPDAVKVRAKTVKASGAPQALAIPAAGGGPQPLATPDAVAAYLGIPVKTLTDWRCRKEGPDYLPVGRYVRYRWPVVVSWAEAREIKLGTAA
jgi:hypothetical protein